MEIASLVMSVDARPVKKASEELSKFTKLAATTEKAVDGLSDALTDAAKAAGVYRDASGKLREANGRLITEARKIELGLDAVSENAKKASKSVKGLGDGAGSASTYLKTMATAAVAAFSVAAIVEFTRRTSVAIAEIERFAQLSNTTNEQFQKAAYAAARFGVEQEKLSDILKDTNDKFGDFFQTGAGPLADFFEQIAPRVGITADAFRGLSGADALGLYVKTLEQAGVNQQDMTFYLEALASDATLLQGVFKDGGAALAAYSAEAENLGIILSDQTIAQAREFQNQLASVNAILGNAGKTITAEMLPALSAITTMFMNAIKESGGMGNAVSNAVDKSVKALAFILDAADAVTRVFGVIGRAGVVAFLALKSGAMDVAASIIEGPLDALNYLIRGFNELGQYIGTTFNEIEPPKFAQGLRQEAADAAAAARIGMDDIQSILMEPLAGRTFIDLYEQAQQVGASLEVAGAAATNATVPFKRLGEEAGSASKEVVKLNKAVADGDHDAAAKAIEDYRNEVEQLEDRLDPVGKATKQYQKDVALLASAHARGEISGEKYATMLATLEGEYAKATEVSGEWAQWTESALERVDGAFADAWKNIGDGFSGFRDSLTSAFKQMLAELAHMAITRPIVMQIGAALGIGGMQSGGQGLLGSLLGGGGGSGGGGIMDLFNAGKTAFSVFNSGFGQAISAGWGSGGLSGAISGGFNYGSSAIGGLFGAGGAVNSAAAGATQAGYSGAQFSGWVGTQKAAANVAAYAPWLSAASGAFMGYQNSGVKGAVAGGVGGYAGVKGGAALGSYFGPIGTAVGAVIGGLLGSIGGSKLFGGEWETKNYGLALSATGGEFFGQSYEDQKKKGGLFGSNKKRTKYKNLDEETAAQFQAAFEATGQGVSDLFEALSFTVTESSLAGLEIARKKISTKGKTDEEIQAAIAEWFGGVADSMTAELNSLFGTGLDLDFEGLTAFVGNLKGVNEVLRYLNVDMYESSVAGGKLAESLSAAAGGLEALSANAATYYDAFFSQAEKTEDSIDAINRAFEAADIELVGSREAYRAMVESIDRTTDEGQKMFATMLALAGQAGQYFDILEQQSAAYYAGFVTSGTKMADQLKAMTDQFAAAGVSIPDTRAAFAAAVEGIDRTTEAGQKMYASLMSIAGQASNYYSILEANAQAAAQAAVSGAQGALGSLSAAINAEKNSITAAYQTQSEAIRSAMSAASESVMQVRAVANTLRSALNGLRIESEKYDAQSRRNAQQIIGQANASTGRVEITEQLERALDTVSKPSEDLFGSFEEYARDYWQTYFAIESLADKADDQLTTEERTLKALESQLDQASRFHNAELERLDGIYEGAQSQLEALLGIDSSVQSVEGALGAFTAALEALQKQQDANASVTSVTGLGGVKRRVDSEGYILDEVGNAITLFGEALKIIDGIAYGGEGSSLKVGADGKLTWLTGDYDKWAQENSIPGFASGGLHGGGLRIVGEKGPEIEATGPSRIFNAGQTADMLSGGSQSDEVAAMRAEMTDALRAIAKHTQQTARRVEYLERWDFDGLPEQRAAV